MDQEPAAADAKAVSFAAERERRERRRGIRRVALSNVDSRTRCRRRCRSGTAEHALALAIALSRQYGSELLIVTAIDHAAAIAAVSGPGLYPTTIPLVIEEYDEMAKSLLEDASTRAVGAGVRATTHVLEGRRRTPSSISRKTAWSTRSSSAPKVNAGCNVRFWEAPPRASCA